MHTIKHACGGQFDCCVRVVGVCEAVRNRRVDNCCKSDRRLIAPSPRHPSEAIHGAGGAPGCACGGAYVL